MSKLYCQLVIYEAIALTILGNLASYDMCHSYVYYEPCKDIVVEQILLNSIRFSYYYYAAYIVGSYYRRLERGELILVSHGKSIVELISAVNNSQNKTDMELQSVRGVAVSHGQAIGIGQQLEDV